MIQLSTITMTGWTTFCENTKEKIKLYWVRGQREGHIHVWREKLGHLGRACKLHWTVQNQAIENRYLYWKWQLDRVPLLKNTSRAQNDNSYKHMVYCRSMMQYTNHIKVDKWITIKDHLMAFALKRLNSNFNCAPLKTHFCCVINSVSKTLASSLRPGASHQSQC